MSEVDVVLEAQKQDEAAHAGCAVILFALALAFAAGFGLAALMGVGA
jgi:hypothetical protein